MYLLSTKEALFISKPRLKVSDMKFGIVVSEFHRAIAEAMLSDAKKKAKELKISLETMWVPGTYESPLAVKALLQRKDVAAVVVLGFIEKGETLHGEQMGLVVSKLLKELELQYEKPVGMGIIGPGATYVQAKKRISLASHAIEAAWKMCKMKE